MFFINVMILPLPALLAMVGLWASVWRLDAIPENSFAEIRFAQSVCLLNFVMVIVFMGIAIYNVPKFVEMAALTSQIASY